MLDISRLEPCANGAAWLAAQTDARTAWETCERSDWMIWLLGRVIPPSDVRFRLAARDIAEIETARRNLAGDATTAELRAARSAARAGAYYAAYAAYADAAPRRTQHAATCGVLRKYFEFAAVMAALEAS